MSITYMERSRAATPIVGQAHSSRHCATALTLNPPLVASIVRN
jgi:hypothetical protein